MKKLPPMLTESVESLPLETVMRDSMMPYAEHVILERALPRVEDGLKPVQRRILYTLSELGMTPQKPHRKSARIVGDCLGKFHPHGESSVYETMVRMAQSFSLRAPLVDGHGNFGSIDGDPAAAMRYTEARMTMLAAEMLSDIDKDTVPFRWNFDDSLKEPDILPARFPNLLVNGASGIAVGLATNIPPHNLVETIDAVIARIDNPKITVPELMKVLPGPDFPTGGILLDTPEIRTAYETGRGKLMVRAKVHIEDGNSGRKLLVITEMPYQVAKAGMLERILKLSEEKKVALSGIHDIRDESDRQGLRAVIEIKRDADPERILATLYKYSDLQVTFGVNLMAIAGGKPEQLTLPRALDCFIQHQETVLTRRTEYELEQSRARLHVLDGLIIAVDNLDAIIALIRQSKNEKEAKAGLMERFSLSEIQAHAILEIRLRRLTGLEILTLRKEHAQVMLDIARLEGILNSRAKLLALFKTELRKLQAAYQDARRTQIIQIDAQETATAAPELPEPEEAAVLRTRGGQLRRMHPKWLEKLPPPEDPKDVPVEIFQTLSDATLYFFTDRGNCYPLSVSTLPEMNRPKERGTLLSGLLLGLEKGETAVKVLCVRPGELETLPNLLFITRKGQVKRTEAAAYWVKRAQFQAISLKDDDTVLAVFPLELPSVVLASAKGMVVQFLTETVPVQGRTAAGVKGMTLDMGDTVAFATPTIPDEGELLFVTDSGYAKRCLLLDFEPQNRGGKGVRGIPFQKNGVNGTRLAAVLPVREPYHVTILQAQSGATTMHAESIPIESRTGKGQAVVVALLGDVVTEAERLL